jgi:non-heme chloroperoxidase
LDILDQQQILKGLNALVLSVVGGKDVIVAPEVCRSVADYAKQCKVVEFEACGHTLFIEGRPSSRAALMDFLQSLG